MRNIQKNLISNWKTSNKISDLIQELPNLCNNFEYQIGNHLLPDLGEYSIKSFKYDINDFLRNPKNKCFKILISKSDKKEDIIFHNRYLIITSTSFIVLIPIDEKYKNFCKIEYIKELYEIDNIEQLLKDDLNCLKIIWSKNNKNQINHINHTLYGHNQKNVANNIYNCLLKTKENLLHNFKYIQKNQYNDVIILEEIIKIKEKLIENKTNDIIFKEISTLYQKIIEILTNKNEDEFLEYIEKFHKFIEIYDKLKQK